MTSSLHVHFLQHDCFTLNQDRKATIHVVSNGLYHLWREHLGVRDARLGNLFCDSLASITYYDGLYILSAQPFAENQVHGLNRQQKKTAITENGKWNMENAQCTQVNLGEEPEMVNKIPLMGLRQGQSVLVSLPESSPWAPILLAYLYPHGLSPNQNLKDYWHWSTVSVPGEKRQQVQKMYALTTNQMCLLHLNLRCFQTN